MGIVFGAVCLIPGCMIENRMSPMLLPTVYGVNAFFMGSRFGGYRPRVFFGTGLELGLLMNVAALAAFWFWRTKQLRSIWILSGTMVFVSLFMTAVLCRSTGATALLFMGVSVLWICQRTQTKWAMWCVLLLTPLYYSARIPNLWTGDNAIELVRATLGAGSRRLTLVPPALREPVHRQGHGTPGVWLGWLGLEPRCRRKWLQAGH